LVERKPERTARSRIVERVVQMVRAEHVLIPAWIPHPNPDIRVTLEDGQQIMRGLINIIDLLLALKNPGYTDALLALLKNVLVERNALYAVWEWAALYDEGLVAQDKVGDDRLGRALDPLFAADRATLQTRIVLAVMNGFDLKMDQNHNDSTSVMIRGAYDGQNAKAVQLKRGHSKERRPDLKQLVYSLCVADCKLCTEKNLRTIDSERGFFVAVVSKTRSEVATFRDAVLAGDVRWEEILRKRADPNDKAFDFIMRCGSLSSARGVYPLLVPIEPEEEARCARSR
jgi:hypothetical protein